jgi:hypothetical protein
LGTNQIIEKLFVFENAELRQLLEAARRAVGSSGHPFLQLAPENSQTNQIVFIYLFNK